MILVEPNSSDPDGHQQENKYVDTSMVLAEPNSFAGLASFLLFFWCYSLGLSFLAFFAPIHSLNR